MSMIEVRNLTKHFKRTQALKGVSFNIEQGDIFGYIGPNGAGKTTTIKILATLLLPTMGEAYIDGIDVIRDPMGVRRIIGYMPDFFGVYDEMKAWEYLDFFAACYRIPKQKRLGIIDVLAFEGLRDAGGIGTYPSQLREKLELEVRDE